MAKLVALLVVAALVAAAVVWLYPADRDLSPMSVRRQGDRGLVEVVRSGDVVVVVDTAEVQPGDVVRTGARGRAKLRLEGDRILSLDAATAVEVVDGAEVEIAGGSVLADAGDRVTVSLDDVGATSAAGAFRVDRSSASTRVGSYEGETRLTAPGQDPTTVRKFFQVSVAAGRTTGIEPYRVDAGDRWDRARLAGVVTLDRRFDRLGSAAARRTGPKHRIFGDFNPLSRRFLSRYAAHRAEDLVVGYAVALNTPRLTVKAAFRRAFGLNDAGAIWGLVAAILESNERATIAELERAIVAPPVAGTGAGAPTSAAGDPESTAPDASGTAPAAPAALEGGDTSGETDGNTPPDDSSPTGTDGGPGGDGDGDGGGGDDGGGDGGGCDNEVDCILPPLPLPTLSVP